MPKASQKLKIDSRKARVLLLYGGGSIKKNGVYMQVADALRKHELFEFGGIEPNPDYATLMKAVKLVRKNKIDFLLAVGGGSVIDGAKFIAVASLYQGEDAWDIVSQGLASSLKKALPIGVVLTLPATGSEMNRNSVISNRATEQKMSFGSEKVYPRFSVLDPKVTYSLPKDQIRNGLVDAYVHILEQYLTYPVDAVVQDRQAEGLLLAIHDIAQRALQSNPPDYEARANYMWVCTNALNHLIGVGVPQDWSTHGIGHSLTALYGWRTPNRWQWFCPGCSGINASKSRRNCCSSDIACLIRKCKSTQNASTAPSRLWLPFSTAWACPPH